MGHLIIHTLEDIITLLPFLFVAFLIIELIEHKFSNKTKKIITKSGKFGPLIGSLLGCFPQCGFSVMATNLYVTEIISLGTLISIYLTTSDEMLPVLITRGVSGSVIVKLLLVKFVIGLLFGFIIDFIIHSKKNNSKKSFHICEDDDCHCEKGVLYSTVIHTVKTFIFIFIVSFVLNLGMDYIGNDILFNVIKNNNILTPIISGAIGLIPNCASSVILTELFVNNVISAGSLIAGLLAGSGIGLIVLFKTNHNWKNSLKVLGICYICGVLSGIVLNLIGFSI